MVRKMEGQLNKLIALIGNLLNIDRIEGERLPLHEEFYNFNELINELVEELQRTTDDHKIIFNPEKEITIFGERERVEQVFTNLISNAFKYSPPSENITVSTSVSDDRVSIAVRDKRLGILKENQENISERFYGVSGPENHTFPGLGLGLFISKEIIKRQGGKIWVESEVNKGSTFYFCLPVDHRTILNNFINA